MTTTNEKIWLVGTGGLVGSALLDALQRAGHPFEAFSRSELDVTEPAALQRLRHAQPSLVLFAAARPWVEGCERDPEGTRPVNVEAPLAFARELERWAGRLVAFSSEYVFDGEASVPYAEAAACRPLNIYGQQKRDLEQGLAKAGDHLAVRTSGVFGPERAQKSFPWQLARATVAKPLRVPTDQLITPTWAPTLAEAVLEAATRRLCGVLHLAGTQPVSRAAFAQRLVEELQLDPRVMQPVPTAALGLAARRPERAALSVERARELGLPLLDLDASLERFVAVYRASKPTR